jgi:hypothetical protein
MIDRTHIESILKLNGLGPDAPDEEIKSLLVSASWHEKDVETALVVLREDSHSNQHIKSVHQVLNTDDKLNSLDLQSMLGIDIEVKSAPSMIIKSQNQALKAQIFSIVVVAVMISILALMGIMWFLKIGLFYANL